MGKLKRRRKSDKVTRRLTREEWALAVFALIVVVTPLAFGAVDPLVQIGVLLLLALGFYIYPPSVSHLSPRANLLVIAAVAVLVLKEFTPASWFGGVSWRSTLTQSFGLKFPWTHHPEPTRALDGLLTAIIAAVWFLWVRMLAFDRDRRPFLIWSMFASCVIVAIVSFATRGIDPHAIYGLRFTPGWTGFGPFPNRNHTASFFAMGICLGAGCAAWAAARKKFPLMAAALLLNGVLLAALFTTQSRGGLIVAGVGLIAFAAIALLKVRTGRAVGVTIGAALIVGAIGLAFAAPVIGRFSSKEGGEVSNMMRVRIWQDTLRMWKDAPLFGHGLGSFTQIFPMYQDVDTGGSIVLHPESSWLQWLAELGLIPVLGGAIALVFYAIPKITAAFSAHRSIFLRASGFAAMTVLLVHSVFDVPAHRWGTAGFALAAFAIACAPNVPASPTAPNAPTPRPRKPAFVPLFIAAFWFLPFLCEQLPWSSVWVQLFLYGDKPFALAPARDASTDFPLNPHLHQAIGILQLDTPAERASGEWQRRFQLAERLMPGSWEIAAAQARACTRAAPGMALHFWQIATERAGHRADEVFGIAIDETSRIPGALASWGQYAHAHPELLLKYAQNSNATEGRNAYDIWWTERGSTRISLGEGEISAFYRLARKLGTPQQLAQWRESRAQLRAADFKTWASLYHEWKSDDLAWEVIAEEVPDPPFAKLGARVDRDHIESLWRTSRDNFNNAREYSAYLYSIGDTETATEVVVTTAHQSKPPDWFIRKGAHLLAAQGKITEAVELYLAEGKFVVVPQR